MKTRSAVFSFLFVLTLLVSACLPRPESSKRLIVDTGGDVVAPTASPTPLPPVDDGGGDTGGGEPEVSLEDAVNATLTAMAPATTPQPTPTATLTVTAIPVDVSTYDGFYTVVGNLPVSSKFEASVREPGDSANFLLRFDEDFENVVLLKVAPDDILMEAWYYPQGVAMPVDLITLLRIGVVDAVTPSDRFQRQVMGTRGIATDSTGELVSQLLPHNYQAVQLGKVSAGSYVVFVVRDDANKAFYRGLIFGLSFDSDEFTVGLDGKLVTATFVVTPRP